MERICGECCNYIHGKLNNPCARGNTHAGYLREGMKCWGMIGDEEPTKVCNKCGRTLPISKFYAAKLTKDNKTSTCKECVGQFWKIKKRKS